VGFPGPHPPYDPPPRFAEPYMKRDDIPIPRPSKAELDALPPPFKAKRDHDVAVDHDSVAWSLEPTEEQLHRLWAYYGANITMIDQSIEALLLPWRRKAIWRMPSSSLRPTMATVWASTA